jgi:hypothetical protein
MIWFFRRGNLQVDGSSRGDVRAVKQLPASRFPLPASSFQLSAFSAGA